MKLKFNSEYLAIGNKYSKFYDPEVIKKIQDRASEQLVKLKELEELEEKEKDQ